MKNILVHGFINETAEIIKELKKENICNIVEWIGTDKECTINHFDFITFKVPSEKYIPNEKNYLQEELFDEFFKYYLKHNRKNQLVYGRENLHDYVDYFNLLFQYFLNLLISKNIEVILFSNLPHEGPDFILYKLAKKLDIKTIIFHQSLFPKKFFYVYNLEDFGEFQEVQNLFPAQPYKINKEFKKNLFYMNNIKPFVYSFLESLCRSFKKKNLRALERYFKIKKYNQNLKDIITDKFDLNSKFVYFPLHLQPELTTATLGGIFQDQALALEKLSELLPQDWYIFVKENPKQIECQRGELFFKRLKNIKNLKMVPLSTNTYDLIANCQFAATITGTAGWESISGGKKVLVFGIPWYKNLPGVFVYNRELSINPILNAQFEHSSLETAVGELYSKMPEGIVDSCYFVNVKDFTPEENAKKVTSFIKEII